MLELISESIFPGKTIDHYETIERLKSHIIWDVYMTDGSVYSVKFIRKNGKVTFGRI